VYINNWATGWKASLICLAEINFSALSCIGCKLDRNLVTYPFVLLVSSGLLLPVCALHPPIFALLVRSPLVAVSRLCNEYLGSSYGPQQEAV
jgi:hypothetical protein